MLADAGLTVTDATGTSVMVIAAVPLLPSLVAVIVAEPTATAVTRPLLSPWRRRCLLLDHVDDAAGERITRASLVTADSGCVAADQRGVRTDARITAHAVPVTSVAVSRRPRPSWSAARSRLSAGPRTRRVNAHRPRRHVVEQ